MMTGRRTRFTKYGHVTSFDEVFFDDGIKYLGQNRKVFTSLFKFLGYVEYLRYINKNFQLNK